MRFAEHFVDPALGFCTGINFFVFEAILIPFEMVAFNIVLHFWTDKIPVAGIMSTFRELFYNSNNGIATYQFAVLFVFQPRQSMSNYHPKTFASFLDCRRQRKDIYDIRVVSVCGCCNDTTFSGRAGLCPSLRQARHLSPHMNSISMVSPLGGDSSSLSVRIEVMTVGKD